MFNRARYKDSTDKDWTAIPDKVATKKYDGAAYFMAVEDDGSLRFFGRKPSVSGTIIEKTLHLAHLTKTKVPGFASYVFNVELIHTGHCPTDKECHSRSTGILNSLYHKSIETQRKTGPIRVVLHDVITPEIPTFADKLTDMVRFAEQYGEPDLLFAIEPWIGQEKVEQLIELTRVNGEEGVVVTSLTLPEIKNVRIKVKHMQTYNLRVIGTNEEKDKYGVPKGSVGSLILMDNKCKLVGDVGTGLTSEMRQRKDWVGKLIQVKCMGVGKEKLRQPVFNGIADGEWDEVEIN